MKHYRAKPGEPYYYITSTLSVMKISRIGGMYDQQLEDAGNMFESEENAIAAIEIIKNALNA